MEGGRHIMMRKGEIYSEGYDGTGC